MRCPTITELPPPPAGRTGWPWTAESRRLPERRDASGDWPAVTVVTPSYNQGQFLEATIRSVLLQGYPNLEYVIMDGGSEDGSAEIIRRDEAWLSFWVSEKDDGHYDAVTRGFAKTSAPIMGWLNSDDMYVPGALRVVGSVFDELPTVDWLTSSCLGSWTEAGDLASFVHAPGYAKSWFFQGLHLKDCGGHKEFIQQESTFWRRSLWRKVGERIDASFSLAGDFDLWAQFWQYAELAMVTAPIGGFRFHAKQKTQDMQAYYEQARTVLAKHGGGRRGLSTKVVAALAALTGCGYERFGSRVLKVRYKPSTQAWELTSRPVV